MVVGREDLSGLRNGWGGERRWKIVAVKESGVTWSPKLGGWQRFPNLAVDPNPLKGEGCWIPGLPGSVG